MNQNVKAIYLPDDTSVCEPIKYIFKSFSKINQELVKFNNQSKQWLVHFNPTKTKFSVSSKKLVKPTYPKLYFNEKPLIFVDRLTQFSLTLYSRITWEDHINQNLEKSMRILNQMKQISFILPRLVKRQIYVTYARS